MGSSTNADNDGWQGPASKDRLQKYLLKLTTSTSTLPTPHHTRTPPTLHPTPTHMASGQLLGWLSRLPRSTAVAAPSGVRSAYGRSPIRNTSQHITPYDHTSLAVEYTRSVMLSGAIHFTGTLSSLVLR